MEPNSLGWKTFAKSWLNKCDPLWMNDEIRQSLSDIFDWCVPMVSTSRLLLRYMIDNSLLLIDCAGFQLLEFVRRHCIQYLEPGDIGILMTTFDIFEMLITDAVKADPVTFEKYIHNWIGPTLIYSLVWGIGGILDSESKRKYDQFVKEVRNIKKNLTHSLMCRSL